MPLPLNRKKDVPVKSPRKKLLEQRVEVYLTLKKQVEKCAKEFEIAKEELKNFTFDGGEEDTAGHINLVVGDKVLQNQLSTSYTHSVDAIEKLKALYPDLYKQIVQTVQVVNMDKLKQAVIRGKIKPKDGKRLLVPKKVYKFFVKDKKELDA